MASAQNSDAFLEAAFQRHQEYRNRGDWSGLADCFTQDVRYFDPIFGWYEGRDAIRDFLESALAGIADRVFQEQWHIVQGDRLVFYWRCTTPEGEPTPSDDPYHGMSTLVYAGDGLFGEQIDVYDRAQARGSRRPAADT